MTNNTFFETPLILGDERVRIEPLEEKHFELLLPTALQPELWRFTIQKINSADDFRFYFDTALKERQEKKSYPFAYFNKQTGEYCGSTRYGNIDLHNKRLEIGWTWLNRSLHGTGFNKHCKFLLLSHGFETMGLNRIELKTGHLNLISQKAMRKIGAVHEGVFRNHVINDDGTVRHSHYFSFIKEEWPATKENFFKEFMSS
ncbi:MAG: GNAT family protein [Ferruginibacter sp.]